jgi:hypothetical protein
MRHPRLNEGRPYTAATAADVLLRIATNRDFTPVLQINDERVQGFEIEFGGDEPVLLLTLDVTPATAPKPGPVDYVASVPVRRRFAAPPAPTNGDLHRWTPDHVRDSLANVVRQLNALAVEGIALEY